MSESCVTTDSGNTVPLYWHSVEGHNELNEPFQLLYVTTNLEQSEAFSKFLARKHNQTLILTDLDKEINEQFPDILLFRDGQGNEAFTLNQATMLPDTLPLGDGLYDESNNVQLLKRALIEHYKEWYDSRRRRDNELASNLPTFAFAAIDLGNPTFTLASIGGATVVGAIQFRRAREAEKLKQALKIWTEYDTKQKINPVQASRELKQNMQNAGLLFSGIPDHDITRFSERTFSELAQKFNAKSNERDLKSRILSLRFPNADQLRNAALWVNFIGIPHGLQKTGHFILEQLGDLFKNPINVEIPKNVLKGAVDTGLLSFRLMKDFAQATRKRIKERSSPSLDDNSSPIENQHISTIDRSNRVLQSADPIIVAQLRQRLEQAQRERVDGAVMSAAYAGETLFMGMHLSACFGAANALSAEKSVVAATNDPENSWMQNPTLILCLSAYSMALAWGAWGHIGREVSRIKDTLRSRAAQISEFSEIIKQGTHQPSP
jgi:hypothetical protein